MRYKLKDGNIIIADAAFIAAYHPDATLEPEEVEAPPRKTILTHREFLKRLTAIEFKAIRQAAKSNADVDMFMYLFERSGAIDIADADTMRGVQMLEAGGILAVGRAAEILN